MTENDQSKLLPRAYDCAPVAAFLSSTPETILGFLVANSEMVVSDGDEDECAYWHENFPEDLIPDHEDPPYERDRHLPKRDCRCDWQGGELGEKEERT